MTDDANQTPVTGARIARLWWPLALSWLMMGVEVPLVSAIIARLPDSKANLAALGALVYPLALLIEAPVIMLLAASTALAKDWKSYKKLRRFAHGAGFALTIVHALLAFTPLYHWVAVDLIKMDPTAVEPGRTGLMIMTPWTWAIASRRFQQGVLIRFEHSRVVVAGTIVRLLTVTLMLAIGYFAASLPGIAVGTVAIACGVIAEAVFAQVFTAPVVRANLRYAPPLSEPLTWAAFTRFYAPLAVTPLITIVLQPIGSYALNRMPDKLLSTAAWSSVYGLVFLFRTAGFAFNEVVVTLIDQPGGAQLLRRIAWTMGLIMTSALALVALTPLGRLWFGGVIELEPDLTEVAVGAVVFAVLMPGYAVLQNFYQGALVHGRRTRSVTEAVVLYLSVATAALAVGIAIDSVRGIVFALAAFSFAGILQTTWLRYRAKPVLAALETRDGTQ